MTKDAWKLFKSAEELIEPEEAIITGTIPEWLNGSFIRVGPAKWDLGKFTMNHLLDGYAMLSKFEINGQSVKFQKKYLQSDAYLKAICAERPLITEFGTKACPNPAKKGLFSRIISSLTPIEMTDNTVCSLYQLSSNELFVTSNTPFFRKIDPVTLSTGEKFDYTKCFGLNSVSVHPLRDDAGDQYNIGFSVLTGPKYHIVKIPGDEKCVTSEDMIQHSSTICSFPSRWNASVGFFHSFGMSANFIIFIEIPYTISLPKAAKSMIKGSTFKDWLEWRPNEVTKFYIIHKKTGNLKKIDYISTHPFFFLHVVNCYEEGNQIVIDLNTYSTPAVIDALYIEKLRSKIELQEVDPPSIHRFVLPLDLTNLSTLPEGLNLINFPNSTATATRRGSQIILSPQILSESGLELPTINPNFLSKKNKFLYATGSIFKNYFTNSICKINTDTKETTLWRENEKYYPGEPLFLPSPYPDNRSTSSKEDSEDSGIIISACSNTLRETEIEENEESKDFLLFLDGKTMKEVGRVKFKTSIPQAMHGIFISNH